MKILNLDKLNTNEQRKLVIGNVSYPVEEMTVENFIATTKAAEDIKDDSLAVQIEATVDMICRSVPTIDSAILKKLSLDQLNMIVAFVRGDDVDGVESGEEGDDQPGK
jgi:hypothetical protein